METLTELPGVDLPAEETGAECAKCRSDILFMEDMFLIRIVVAYMDGGKLTYRNIFESNGKLRYDHGFFCYGCWEEVEEEVSLVNEDVPAIKDAAGLLSCDICDCDIREGETLGLLELGEMRLSIRQPNGNLTPKFTVTGRAERHICIGCLYHLDTNAESGLWTDDIEAIADVFVCQEGVYERCWRTGNCTCPAAIHGK